MRAALAAFARGLGAAVVFVLAVAGGAVLHLDVPAVRRAIVARVDQVLASALAGRIVVERVGSLGATHVTDVDARVEDPDGKTVLRVQGLGASIATWDLLRSLAASPDVRVAIDEVSVRQADVSLDADASGQLRLARAFAPRVPAAPPTSGGGGVRLSIPHGLLAHVALHGRPPAGPEIAAYLDGTDATVSVTPDKLALEVKHALIAERDLSDGMTTLGVLDARFEQPAPDGSDRYVRASWRGLVGALAGTAEATYDAGRVVAVVDVPESRPECVRGLWASCPFGETVSAHLEARGSLPHLYLGARATVGKGVVTVLGPASVGDEVRGIFHVEATGVDARALAPSAPWTELGASGDVLLVSTATGAAGAIVDLAFAGGTVEGARVPAASITGQIRAERHRRSRRPRRPGDPRARRARDGGAAPHPRWDVVPGGLRRPRRRSTPRRHAAPRASRARQRDRTRPRHDRSGQGHPGRARRCFRQRGRRRQRRSGRGDAHRSRRRSPRFPLHRRHCPRQHPPGGEAPLRRPEGPARGHPRERRRARLDTWPRRRLRRARQRRPRGWDDAA